MTKVIKPAVNERALYDRARRADTGWGRRILADKITRNVIAYLNVHPEQPTTVHPRIWKACDLLDIYFDSPRWDEVLDPFTFDISSGAHCVLGQLGGQKIPGDGYANWQTQNYSMGRYALIGWLDHNLDLAYKLGENYEDIVAVFDTDLGRRNISYLTQNVMWMLAILWRRQSRKENNHD
jgi:hypothetical protein